MANNTTNKWYVRQDGNITGPFSQQVISNNVKLGRLSVHDELSSDKISWSLIQLSGIFSHPTNTHNEHSQRLLDERDGFDRRQTQDKAEEQSFKARRQKERRSPEVYANILRRQLRTELLQKYRDRATLSKRPFLALILLVTVIAIVAIVFPTKIPMPSANCNALPIANVDWSNCSKMYVNLTSKNLAGAQLTNSQFFSAKLMNVNLDNADLAYADLRLSDLSYSSMVSANLLGSDLQNVDLSYADLSNANLAFANLAGAKLGAANLENTNLSKAIWINGKTCAPDSIGHCILNE